MRKFGLIGFPLGHSFSQKYFTGKFLKEGITDTVYENFPIDCIDKFPELILKEKELCGLNVTIPYKTEVIRYLDYLDPEAKEIGSVNVIVIRRRGDKPFLSGYNSDIKGITDSVIPFINKGIRKALVLGSGGSSNAVKYTLSKLGVEVTIISRNPQPGQRSYSDISRVLLDSTDLIVNTTPLGMYPDTGSKPPLNYSFLGEKHILFDLVYNPEMTAFLKMGQERGCKIVTGLDMLYSQAERSWEIWNDPAN